MASEIERTKLTFSNSFDESIAGKNLRDYFIKESFDAYLLPFRYISLSLYEKSLAEIELQNVYIFYTTTA